MKFSGSPRRLGANSVRDVRAANKTTKPARSFVV